MEAQKLFNRDAEFAVKIISGGMKTCTLRFPTDDELIAYFRKQKSISHFLGRGKFYLDPVNSEPYDLALFNKIRLDKDGPEFDAAEASKVLEKLYKQEVTGSQWDGASFIVSLSVPGASVEHTMRAPLARDVSEYQRSIPRTILDAKIGERRTDIVPIGRLYDSAFVSASGYTGSIPIVHKVAVITEILERLDALESQPQEGE